MALTKDQLDALVGLVFGTVVKHIRTKRNQTRGPFAALIGLSADELDWLEDGTEASVTTLYRLSEALGLSSARIATATQITVNKIHDRGDLAAAIKVKDWGKATQIIEKALETVHDLLKLPPPEQVPLDLGAPPRISNEVYKLPIAAEKPMPLTRIVDVEEDEEGDFDEEADSDADADADADFEDDDADDEVEPPRAPATPSRVPRRPRPEPPLPEVVMKPSTNQGVQRRGPGRPRKYPVPPA